MDEISGIVGIVSGLIAIFTFATGINSLSELRTSGKSKEARAVASAKPTLLRLVLLGLVFAVSITVTASMGLSGSDTGGIACLLLIISATAVLAFQLWLSKVIPLMVYGTAAAIGIAVLGLTFGSVARGEEAFGLAAGVIIGLGTFAITAMSTLR